jgi:hypothetical protein
MFGKISIWMERRNFGFLEVAVPIGNGSYRIDKYFLHRSKIALRPDVIRPGYFADFEVEELDVQPLTENYLPRAINVAIYRTEEDYRASQQLTGELATKRQPVVQPSGVSR